MQEELQSLIDRIQNQGVEKAQKQADDIISKTKKDAENIVKEAEKKADDIVKEAEKKARQYTQRSTKALQQAARDVIIEVGHGIEKVFLDIVSQSLENPLKSEEIIKLVESMVQAYAEKGMTETNITVLVNPSDQKKLKELYLQQYRDKLGKGVEIQSDNTIIKGFRVSFEDNKVYHDFTQSAIAESFSELLRPDLAKIVHKVAEEQVQRQDESS
jgi:V/A-type H+/Na+-transporting ATPase subunit E